MLVPKSLLFQIDQISDRDLRHKARSLLACYVAYLELQSETPSFAERARSLASELRRLGISASLLPSAGGRTEVINSWTNDRGIGPS